MVVVSVAHYIYPNYRFYQSLKLNLWIFYATND